MLKNHKERTKNQRNIQFTSWIITPKATAKIKQVVVLNGFLKTIIGNCVSLSRPLIGRLFSSWPDKTRNSLCRLGHMVIQNKRMV